MPSTVLVTGDIAASITDKNLCPSRTCSSSIKKEKEATGVCEGTVYFRAQITQVAPVYLLKS